MQASKIKAAYRRESKRWHPDHCKQANCGRRFIAITSAKDGLLQRTANIQQQEAARDPNDWHVWSVASKAAVRATNDPASVLAREASAGKAARSAADKAVEQFADIPRQWREELRRVAQRAASDAAFDAAERADFEVAFNAARDALRKAPRQSAERAAREAATTAATASAEAQREAAWSAAEAAAWGAVLNETARWEAEWAADERRRAEQREAERRQAEQREAERQRDDSGTKRHAEHRSVKPQEVQRRRDRNAAAQPPYQLADLGDGGLDAVLAGVEAARIHGRRPEVLRPVQLGDPLIRPAGHDGLAGNKCLEAW
jgi:hypothetical protein